MKILVLTKRQYMNKDLLDDRFGRFYELPKELAKRGHQVRGVCLSYRKRKEGQLPGAGIDKTLVNWSSYNLGRTAVPGYYTYKKKINQLCAEFNPDIIWGCSDALHIINAHKISRNFNIPCVADLYDNFESYSITKVPGIYSSFKKAVHSVAGVTCVSKLLQEYVEENYLPTGKVITLSNGIPLNHFKPLNASTSRQEFGLPSKGMLIGTAGALTSSRGIEILFKAAKCMIEEDPNLHLILAGPVESNTKIPERENIHYLGELDYEKIPTFLNTLDVGVICNRDTTFGRYCFPQKFYEMLACELPIVAADVGSMSQLLENHKACLFEPSSSEALRTAIRKQLREGLIPDIPIPTWQDLAKDLEQFLDYL